MVFNASGTMKTLKCVVTAILLGLVVLSIGFGSTDARTLSRDDDFFAAPILKRNTFWTKKSLDAFNTIPHNAMDFGRDTEEKYRETIEIYACYVERCVDSFVTCSRQADSETLFDACKMLHQMCASSCAASRQGRHDLGL